jgi:uncharacterized protein
MSVFYLDTSAIVKRYVPETGMAWVRALADSAAGNNLRLCEVILAETAAAVAAKHRVPSGITLTERDGILRRFLQHCNDEYILVPLNRAVIDRAIMLTPSHWLRGYDAVQLAAALLVNAQYLIAGLPPLTFVTADNDLLAAVFAEGLTTDDPNMHP